MYFVYFLSLSPIVASIPNNMNQPIVTVNPLHTIISSKPHPITRRDICHTICNVLCTNSFSQKGTKTFSTILINMHVHVHLID